MSEKNKNILIGGLLAVVAIMAVGYAAFSTTLNINGTANIASTWDVQITGITYNVPPTVAFNSGTRTNTAANVSNTYTATTATFVANFESPGDTITYTVTVKNNGSIDAKVNDISFSQGTDKATTYTYADIAKGDALAAGESTTFTVTVTYNTSVTSQPETSALSNSLSMSLEFVQD